MDLPYNNASASRVMGVASALKNRGYDIYCFGHSKNGISQSNTDNIYCYNDPYPTTFHSFIKTFGNAERLKKILSSQNPREIFAVFFTSIGHINLKFLGKWCKKYKIPLIYDCGDIIRSSTKGFPFNIVSRFEFSLFERNVKKYASIMAISEYISNYFKGSVYSSFVIPCVANRNSNKYAFKAANKVDNRTVNLFYCGVPGKNFCKDRVDLLVRSFNKFDNGNFKMYIAGLDKQIFNSLNPNKNIINLGILSNNDCINYMKQMDATVLFRDDNEMTKAGFPSKITESIMCGVPVVCNLTSDLGLYLDQSNSITVSGFGLTQCDKLFEKIFALRKSDFENIKKSCKIDNSLESSEWTDKILLGIKNAAKRYE